MDERSSQTSRRAFLHVAGTGSALAVGSLAGCTGLGGSTAEDPGDVPEERFQQPRIPDDRRDAIERIEEFREVYRVERLGGLATVDAYVDGAIYEVSDVTETVAEQTMGQFEAPLVVFFAAKVNLVGTATSFASAERIADEATPVFTRELANQGVEDVEEVEPGEPLPDVDDGHSREFRGSYETSRIEQEATLPDGSTLPMVVPARRLETAAFQTVWKPDAGTALVAGGGYPNEDFETRTGGSVTGEEGDGIDVEVSIDLNLEPEAYRQELVTLAESIQ